MTPGPSRECGITFFVKGRPKSARQSRDSTVAARRVQSVTVPSSRVSRECRFLLLGIGFLLASKKANLSFKSPSPKPHLDRTGSVFALPKCVIFGIATQKFGQCQTLWELFWGPEFLPEGPNPRLLGFIVRRCPPSWIFFQIFFELSTKVAFAKAAFDALQKNARRDFVGFRMLKWHFPFTCLQEVVFCLNL